MREECPRLEPSRTLYASRRKRIRKPATLRVRVRVQRPHQFRAVVVGHGCVRRRERVAEVESRDGPPGGPCSPPSRPPCPRPSVPAALRALDVLPGCPPRFRCHGRPTARLVDNSPVPGQTPRSSTRASARQDRPNGYRQPRRCLLLGCRPRAEAITSSASEPPPRACRPSLVYRTERSQGWRASSSSTSAGSGPLRDPRPRRRENPLPQPPYVILDPPPLDGVPVNGRVLRSCHHAHCARGVNLSSGSGASIIFLFTGSPDRVKSAFGAGHQARYPAGFPTRPPGGGGQYVPVSRRLSAAGIRFSVILARRGGIGRPNGGKSSRTAMLKLGRVAMQPECSASAPLRRRLPSATTRSRSTRRGWIRWAEPLIEVRADVHGRIDGPARDAVLREIFALLCPLAGGWSTPEWC